jgi:hypothetical protein
MKYIGKLKDLKAKRLKQNPKRQLCSIYILVFTIPYGSPHTSLIPKLQVASRVWLIHSPTLAASRTTIRSHYKRMWFLSHHGLAIYIKMYLKAKEELWKLKYFTMQKYNLQNNPLNETQILQNIITL